MHIRDYDRWTPFLKEAMRHQAECVKISDCPYSGQTLLVKRQFPDVMLVDKHYDPFVTTFNVTSEEMKSYDSIFYAGQPQDGRLSAEKVKKAFSSWKQKLPVSTVEKILSLCDDDGDGCLDRYEWAVALHLSRRVCKADPIPEKVKLMR